MIKVTIYKTAQDVYTGFKSQGHAGYAEYGQDIVCSAVSVLIINTLNAIERFTEDKVIVTSKENDGLIEAKFEAVPGHDARLLMDALVLGLQEIHDDYQGDYIRLLFKEV